MSSLVSFAVLLLFYAAASQATVQWMNKIEDGKEYELEKFMFNPDKPFVRRMIGQATIWGVPELTSFSIHFIPREHCQEVWVCSTPWKELKDVTKKTFDSGLDKEKRPCSDLHVFRPLEQSVEINVRYHDGEYERIRTPGSGSLGSIHNFPWAKATFVNQGKSASPGNFDLEVAKEDRDTQGGVSEKHMKVARINNMPLIITSSPYCKVEVKADTPEGKPVDFINIAKEVNMPEFPIWNMKLVDNKDQKKTFNGLLVRSAVKKYTLSTKSQCPPLWKPEFESISNTWVTARSNMVEDSLYFTYQLKRKAECTLGTAQDATLVAAETERASIKLQIENPEKCNWLRICFLEGEDKSMCMNPEKSIEIMPIYKLFVGIDSDEARRLDVPSNELTHFRFEVTRNKISTNKEYRLTMSYSFTNDLSAVEYHMFASEAVYAKWLEGGQRVSLIRDRQCMARLVTDHMYQTDNKKGKQCLTVGKCDVAYVNELPDETPAKAYTKEKIDEITKNVR